MCYSAWFCPIVRRGENSGEYDCCPSCQTKQSPFFHYHDPGPPPRHHSSQKPEHGRISVSACKQLPSVTITTRRLITLHGNVAGHRALVLVDSGATGNFVSSSFVTQHRLVTVPLSKEDTVVFADGSKQTASALVSSVPISIATYADRLDLASIPLSGYDIILGMTWLEQYNPNVDWRQKMISFIDSSENKHILLSEECRVTPSSPFSGLVVVDGTPSHQHLPKQPECGAKRKRRTRRQSASLIQLRLHAM